MAAIFGLIVLLFMALVIIGFLKKFFEVFIGFAIVIAIIGACLYFFSWYVNIGILIALVFIGYLLGKAEEDKFNKNLDRAFQAIKMTNNEIIDKLDLRRIFKDISNDDFEKIIKWLLENNLIEVIDIQNKILYGLRSRKQVCIDSENNNKTNQPQSNEIYLD